MNEDTVIVISGVNMKDQESFIIGVATSIEIGDDLLKEYFGVNKYTITLNIDVTDYPDIAKKFHLIDNDSDDYTIYYQYFNINKL